MVTTLPPPPPDAGAGILRWTREQYEGLLELGVFQNGDRVELLDGVIFEIPVHNPPHASALRRAHKTLARFFAEPLFLISMQLPLALDDLSEPEPDLAVIVGRIEDYELAHPATAALIVEISDTTLRRDQGPKRDAYARNGIAEYWIVNLLDRRLEVHRRPARGVYTETRLLYPGDAVSPLGHPDAAIPVSDLLPADTAGA